MSSLSQEIQDIWRTKDDFDKVLNGSLFDAIDALQQPISSNDPVWAKIVFTILFNYVMGFLLYHFRFSYGHPEAYKPERQRDLEQHIRKLLSKQPARDLISKVCISSLHGKGWQTLYGILPGRIRFTLNPSRLYRRVRSQPTKLFFHLLQKTPAGATMGLEIFGLFDNYTPEEFDELVLRIQHHSHHKRSYAFNEWDISYIVRLLARPQAITQQEHERLVGQILNMEFTREDIRAEVLAELARSSDKAAAALDTYQKSDLIDRLVTSAHRNPQSMKKLISSVELFSSYGANIDEKLAKLERLEISSAEALLQTTSDEESAYASVVCVATHISALTVEAREMLASHLNSSNLYLRYLSACALLRFARSVPAERAKVFDSIKEIAIGPQHLDVTYEEAHRPGPSQKMAVQFLLDLAESDPRLIWDFLMDLRTTWKKEFAAPLAKFFSTCEMADNCLEKLVDHLLDGNLSEFRVSASQQCSEMPNIPLDRVLDQIAKNDLLSYYGNDNDAASPEAQLLRVCAGYIYRVWSCLTFLTAYISKLRTPHFAVMAALIILAKSSRREWAYRQYLEDSYVSVCQDLSLAIRLLERVDEEEILNLLAELECEADDGTREQIMRSLRFFPRANPAIMALIKKGLADPEREVRKAAQASLSCLSYLDAEGIDLVIDEVLSPTGDFFATMGDNLTKYPQPIAPSALPRVMELLRTSSELTSDQVRELWLIEYCLSVLKFVPQDGTELIELYTHKLQTNYGNEDLRRHLRPYFILALGRVRPVTPETLKMLLNFTEPGMARMMLRTLKDIDFSEVKMAAAIALSEMGSDLTNGVDWKTREIIATRLIWAVKQALPSTSTFVGEKDLFPRDPNDAMYQSAKIMASVIKDYKAREQVATQGITDLE